MAVASLVLGILSAILALVPGCGFLSLIPAAVGLILGIIGAKSDPKNPGQPKPGKGMAIAGIVLNIVAVLLCVAWALFFKAVGDEATKEFETKLSSMPAGNQALYKKDALAVGQQLEFTGDVSAVEGPNKLLFHTNIADMVHVTFKEPVTAKVGQILSFSGKVTKVGSGLIDQHEVSDAELK